MDQIRYSLLLFVVGALAGCGGAVEVENGSGAQNGGAQNGGGAQNSGAAAGAANAEQVIRESCSALCTPGTPASCEGSVSSTCASNCVKKAAAVGTCLQPWLGLVDCLSSRRGQPCSGDTSSDQSCSAEFERAKGCLGGEDPLVNETRPNVTPGNAEGRAPIPDVAESEVRCEALPAIAVDECNAGGTAQTPGANECSTFCTEASGTLWQSSCKDGKCSCSRDGVSYCSCSQEPDASDCRSCCPVLPP